MNLLKIENRQKSFNSLNSLYKHLVYITSSNVLNDLFNIPFIYAIAVP